MLDRDGDWIVFRNAEFRDECVVIDEGRIYEYTGPNTTTGRGKSARYTDDAVPKDLAWRDESVAAMGNDSFHYPSTFTNSEGLLGTDIEHPVVSLTQGDSGNYADNSSVKIEYKYVGSAEVTAFVDELIARVGEFISMFDLNGNLKQFTTEAIEDVAYEVQSYNLGWWATLFEAPFPKTTDGNITEEVGQIFGGTTANKVPVLDLNNLNYTPSGESGYGQPDSDMLGPLDGIKFLFRFDVDGPTFNTHLGDIPFRCTIYDLLGNVWVSDVKVRFQKVTQEMNFPFSSFRIFRSRLQPGFEIANYVVRAINAELKITEIFDRRLVKRINFQCMLTHDDQGRYDPWTWYSVLERATSTLSGITINHIGEIDALHFTKTPIAIARDEGDGSDNTLGERHLNTVIKEYPNISNTVQLQKIANSELDIAKHQERRFTLTLYDRCDIDINDRIKISDQSLIDSAGLELIVSKVTYNVNSNTSESGLITTIEAYKEVGI